MKARRRPEARSRSAAASGESSQTRTPSSSARPQPALMDSGVRLELLRAGFELELEQAGQLVEPGEHARLVAALAHACEQVSEARFDGVQGLEPAVAELELDAPAIAFDAGPAQEPLLLEAVDQGGDGRPPHRGPGRQLGRPPRPVPDPQEHPVLRQRQADLLGSLLEQAARDGDSPHCPGQDVPVVPHSSLGYRIIRGLTIRAGAGRIEVPRMSRTSVHTSLSAREAAKVGMGLAVIAREHPDRLAITSPSGDRSFAYLNERVNQLVRALRTRGLQAGDAVAMVCSNRPEFAVGYFAALRGGFRITPINWHLTAPEIGYIIDNCEAKAFLADSAFAQAAAGAHRAAPDAAAALSIGGPVPGFEDFEDALGAEPADDIEDPVLGRSMLYTSGTTGRPKGVYRKQEPTRRQGYTNIVNRIGYRPGGDVHLCSGPLYHAAPLAFSLVMPLGLGVGVVLMERFDAARALELIGGYRVTHTHMVPIMFHRMLALPEEERARFDLSSLRMVLHGAAPCPVPVKQALIEWLGPVVYEYYAATEGWGSFVTSEEWLEKPGTVGKPEEGQVEIRDEEGKAQPPGTPGTIYLRAAELGRFEYYKDKEKTRKSYAGDHFTLGDVGYLDDDGYLFLCDRSADVIISGGVNIYPAEVDAVLLTHPAVRDAATIGIPNEEWGEAVASVVELREGYAANDELAQQLVDHCRAQLAHYKCPRKVEFRDTLPRHDTGKIYRRLLRDEYWQGREKRI